MAAARTGDVAGGDGDRADADVLAADLLDACERDEQVAYRLAPGTDVAALRSAIRRRARRRGVRIRTGLVDTDSPGDTLAVVRADAALWSESTAVMRIKLDPDA